MIFDLLTLKMTLNDVNNTRNELPLSKSHENEVLHLFLASFVEKSYLTVKYLATILFLTLERTFDLVANFGSIP